MTSQAKDGACAFAWRMYLLLHSGVHENDGRRTALHRYVTSLWEAGEHDFNTLQVAALVYLKKLDQSGDDREAQRAASKVLERARRIEAA
jgi:hypothetical protein